MVHTFVNLIPQHILPETFFALHEELVEAPDKKNIPYKHENRTSFRIKQFAFELYDKKKGEDQFILSNTIS